MKNKLSALLACFAFTLPGFAEDEVEPLTVSFTESTYTVPEG